MAGLNWKNQVHSRERDELLPLLSSFALSVPSIKKPPILVTGAHRSGTTWVGKILASCHGCYWVGELFNPSVFPHLQSDRAHPVQYLHLPPGREFSQYKRRLTHAIYGTSTLTESVSGISLRMKLGALRNLVLRRQPIIKDPISLFSVEWLEQNLGCRPIIIIRHPAAFAGSLKRIGWRFDFSNFLHQREYLHPFLHDKWPLVEKFHTDPPDPVEEWGFLWSLFYETVSEYQRKHPHWIFMKHEALSRDPVAGFKSLTRRLGLELTQASGDLLSSKREAPPGAGDPRQHVLHRDSRKNIKEWTRRLTPEETRQLKKLTAPLWREFYEEDSWTADPQ